MPSVGSSYYDFGMNLAPLDRSLADADRKIVAFEQRVDRFSRRSIPMPSFAPLNIPTTPTPAPAPRAPAPTPGGASASDKQILALANAQAAAARAAGNHAEAESILQVALGRVDKSSIAAIRTSTNLLNVQNRLANNKGPVTLPRTIDGLSGSAATAADKLRVLGTAFVALGAVKGLADTAVQFRDLALGTQRADNSLRILAGSTRLYDEALAAAKNQQILFGGSLQENIEGLSGLVTVSRSAGVSLQSLIDVSQQLAVKDPSQGVAGARIALQEALSGDPVSLARRYEIPRKALAAIRDEATSGADKIKIISDYLTGVGIAAGAAADAVPAATRELNAMNAEAEAAKIALGTLIAEGFRPLVREATQAFGGIGQGLKNFNAIDTKMKELSGTLVQGSADFQAYSASATDAANQLLVNTGQRLPILNEQQFKVAKGFVDIGLSAEAAVAKVEPFSRALGDVGNIGARLTESGLPTTEIDALAARLSNLVVAGGQVSDATAQMTRDFLLGKIGPEQFAAGIDALEISQRANIRATDEAIIASQRMGPAIDASKIAVDEETKTLQDAILKKYESAQASERLAEAEAFIANIGKQVQAGLINVADGAQIVGDKFGFARDKALEFVDASARAARVTVSQQNRQNVFSDLLKFGGQAATYLKDQQELAKAERDQAFALADTAGQAKILKGELDKLTPGTDEYVRKQTELRLAERQLAEERDRTRLRGAKSATSLANKGLSALDKDAISLQEDYASQLAEVNRQLENGNLSAHQRNQLLIKQRDLQEKIAKDARSAADAARDAALASNQDAQKRLLEARELRGLDEQAKNSAASNEEREAARLKAEEIRLQQAQRAADIAEKTEKAQKAGPIPDPTQSEQVAAQAERNKAEQERLKAAQAPQPPTAPPLQPPPAPVLPVAPPTPPSLLIPPQVLAQPPVNVTVNLTVQEGRITNASVDGVDATLDLIFNGARANNLIGGRAP